METQNELEEADYYKIFDLDEIFSLNHKQLENKYHQLQQQYHPDQLIGNNQKQDQKIINIAANINNAYQVLNNPVARASYLLEKWGYKKVLENRYLSPKFINQQILWREKLQNCQDQTKLIGYLKIIKRNIKKVEKKIDDDFNKLRSIDVSPKAIGEKIKQLQFWLKLYELVAEKTV